MKKLAVIFMLLLVGSSLAAPPASLTISTPREFAAMVSERILAQYPDLKLENGDSPLSFRLSDASGKNVHHIDLTRTYEEYRLASPDNREAIVQRSVAAFVQTSEPTPSTWAEVKPRLRPIVRPGVEIDGEELTLRAKNPGEQTPTFPRKAVAGPLVASLAIDYPDAIRRVADSDVKDWGVSLDEALAIAVTNLAAAKDKPFVERAPGLWIAANDDGVDSARLLLVDAIKKLPLNGKPVALTPARDLLIVTGDADAKGLEGLLALGEQASQMQRGMAAPVLRLEDDRWVEWSPARGGPQADAILAWNVGAMKAIYDSQTQNINATLKEDIYVANVLAFELPDGRTLAFTTYALGVHTMLPRAAYVALGRANGENFDKLGFVPWDRFVAALGPKLVAKPYTPARWLIIAAPTEAELEKMQIEPIDSVLSPNK